MSEWWSTIVQTSPDEEMSPRFPHLLGAQPKGSNCVLCTR